MRERSVHGVSRTGAREPAAEELTVVRDGAAGATVVVLQRGAPSHDPFSDASEPVLLRLARAFTSYTEWPQDRPAVLAVRTAPESLLAAIGRFDRIDLARLALLQFQLHDLLPRTVYLDDAAVDAACVELAGLLEQTLGGATLRGARFTAVPRGGLFVLGRLAYLLDLHHAQLEPRGPDGPSGPLVVVDDIAISGRRSAAFLGDRHEDALVLATLYSHPELRWKLARREPRLQAFVSARDLRDHHRSHTERQAFIASWLARAKDADDPWIGRSDHVCFPWNEPDVKLWNPAIARVERGWPMIPAEMCLKHQSRTRSPALTVQVQPEMPGRYRPPEDVVYGSFDGAVVIAALATARVTTLEGRAAAMWQVLAGPRDALVPSSDSRGDLPTGFGEAELTAFITERLDEGLLRDTHA